MGRSVSTELISIGTDVTGSSPVGVVGDLAPARATVSKSRIVPVRFAPDDYVSVERASGAAGVSISEFVRQSVLLSGGVAKSEGGSGTLSGDERLLFGALLEEIKFVGANINQIAMRLNTGRVELVEGVDESLRELRNVLGGLAFELRQLSPDAARDVNEAGAGYNA